MQLRVRLSGDGDRTLCFRHAVLRCLRGEEISVDASEYDPEWTGWDECKDCEEEVTS